MSLLRLAFWLALLVLLLPTDAQQQARFSNFANTAMERFTTFCDRNDRTCSVGSQVWSTFLRKAEFGIRLVGDLLGAGGRQAPQVSEGAPPPPGPARDRRAGKADPRGTLAPPDHYRPPWRGPARAGGS
jgi:hypothetical protein